MSPALCFYKFGERCLNRVQVLANAVYNHGLRIKHDVWMAARAARVRTADNVAPGVAQVSIFLCDHSNILLCMYLTGSMVW